MDKLTAVDFLKEPYKLWCHLQKECLVTDVAEKMEQYAAQKVQEVKKSIILSGGHVHIDVDTYKGMIKKNEMAVSLVNAKLDILMNFTETNIDRFRSTTERLNESVDILREIGGLLHVAAVSMSPQGKNICDKALKRSEEFLSQLENEKKDGDNSHM